MVDGPGNDKSHLISGNPKTKNLKLETGIRNPETGNQEPETGNREPAETTNQRNRGLQIGENYFA